jgi:hypothetical protein
MRTVVVLLAALALNGQSALTPDLEVLTKIRTRMMFNLEHQPNYTCVETIERSSRPKSTNKLRIIDTLRLEVALVDGREMFAWPGSRKFEEFDISKIVTNGAIGNGNFGTHARALFASRVATFHYLGEVDLEGRKAIRFDYNVPLMLSGYNIRTGTGSAIVGYHGSFYVNPATFDMERIVVIADDVPPELWLSSAQDKIDYAMAHIGEGDFLLPSQSELTMVDLNGAENRNHVKFTNCRQYSGESVITFDEAPASKPDTAPAITREFDIPKGLEIELGLTEEIDVRKVAIGDPVHARVLHDVKRNGEILIPKGATATGRVTRMERHDAYAMIGMAFPEIEAPGIRARMKGSLDRTLGVNPVRSRAPHGTAIQPGEGVFPVNETQLHLPKGCIIVWRT